MAKQPYYHSASILFTCTEPLECEAVSLFLHEAMQMLEKTSRSASRREFIQLIRTTIVCDDVTVEPGDPADL